MKKQIFILMIASMAFIQCTTDDEGNETTNNQSQIDEAQSIAETGTWRVTNFNDSGQDETSDFTGYNFSFNSDGTLVASNGTVIVNGTWSVTDDSNSSSNDNSDNDIDFNIDFAVSDDNDFEDLNDDWDIVSISGSKIDLRDVSGGNGGTDLLTFEKN